MTISLFAQPASRPVPPGCSSLNSNVFCDNNVYFIADLNTVNIPINVSGLGNFILDVNVFTQITHTFASDMDIVLTSPSGRQVILTSDNGGQNDNVFNGTTWDDDGAEGVKDALYTNNVVKPSLKPEEGLGDFTGDNPNGVWTLSITDDLTGDVGQLSSFCLDIASISSPNLVNSNFSNNNTQPINDLALTTSTIVVAGLEDYITDVNVTTFITHSFGADLDVTLTSPSGTTAVLTTDNGSSFDNIFNGTIWDDSADDLVGDHIYTNLVLASPLSPETGFGAFIGENPNGIWTLSIVDDQALDVGNLSSWSLSISTGSCTPIPTLSEWAFIVLMLSIIIIGLVVFYQIKSNSKIVSIIK